MIFRRRVGYSWYYIERGFLVPAMVANEQNKTVCGWCVSNLKLAAKGGLRAGTIIACFVLFVLAFFR